MRPRSRIGAAVAYLLVKTFHLVFVIAWMATLFYLPRILVNLGEGGAHPEVRARLVLMGKRLYGFGHSMFGIALILGAVLWLHFGIAGGWLHAKIALVALLFVYFVLSGRRLKKIAAGGALPDPTRMRWWNEVPVVVLAAIVWLVLAKPF
ncbi:CopD family protein [Chiayiivirga flava]|uniref:Protoporphyrinogen IX oxidase n=1 Tax=Chiayiivirga flava TaxID=659595 RepID=A0A7W8D703_9GAMM|nr:CopD family protein [Chiayiivirga flava]MBB5209074.1 putative membrane protein [Chiayiivirga flava]